MSFWNKIFKKKQPQQLEDAYKLSITDTYVRVEHPERKTEQISWNNIEYIKFINTNSGSWLPDVWLALLGKEEGCLIPQGAKGYDEVYEIVSKYEGFNFENATESLLCTENAEFDLWVKE